MVTLYEKNMFHVTQMVAWISRFYILDDLSPSSTKKIQTWLTILEYVEKSTPRKESALANDIFPD